MPIFTIDLDLAVATPRLWLACKDGQVVSSKVAPQMFAPVEKGSVSPISKVGMERTTKFGPALPEGAYVKDLVTALDDATYTLSLQEVEGGHLAMGFTKWIGTIKMIASEDKKRTKVSVTVEYEGGNEAIVAQAKEEYTNLITGVGAYLQSSGEYA